MTEQFPSNQLDEPKFLRAWNDALARAVMERDTEIDRLHTALAKAYRLWSSEQGRVCQTANEMARVISHALENDPRHEAARLADVAPTQSCRCPAKRGEDCPLTAEECSQRAALNGTGGL